MFGLGARVYVLVFCLACLIYSRQVYADASSQSTRERVELKSYLLTLSNFYSVSILFKDEELGDVKVIPIGLDKNIEQTLQRILANTQLTYKKTKSGIIVFPQSPSSEKKHDYEVVIKGFRNSLVNAKNLKMNSYGVQDSIVAEDIADFPDLNLADSLQRIPGVTINREAGEGRQISLRGLSPGFTLVQLNGMDVLSNNDSPMDSRGQKARDRAFDFNIFASELFQQVDVKKTYFASDQEGGLAGTVQLTTPKPFSNEGFQTVVSAFVGNNQYTEDLAPKISGLISNTWGNFGALFSIAYSSRDTEEQGANTTRWRRESPNGADISALSSADQQAWIDREIYVPRGNRYSVWQSEQSRIGLTTSFQYKDDRKDISLDILASEFESLRDEFHLYTRGFNSTPSIPGVTRVNEVEINNANELIYADYSDAQMATETRQQETSTRFVQGSLNGTWNINSALNLHTLFGWANSDFEIPISHKIYTEGVSDISVDYRPDRYYASIDYSSDTTDVNQWFFHEVDLEQYFAKSEYRFFSIDLDYQYGDGQLLKGGLSNKVFENATARADADNIFRAQWDAFRLGTPVGQQDANGVTAIDNRIPEDLVYVMNDHERANWVAFDSERTLNFLGVQTEDHIFSERGGSFGIRDSEDGLQENTYAVYFEHIWKTLLFNKDMTVVNGMRYVKTETTTQGNGTENRERLSRNYENFLPSSQVSYWVTDSIALKAGVSRNITRPDINDLSSSVHFSRRSNDTLVAHGVNADLEPYISNNFDVSVEKYFNNSGYLSVGYFNKFIDDYIVTRASRTPILNISFPDSSGRSEEVIYTARINSESARLSGIEFIYQSDFEWLPGLWKNMGAIINYTYTDGEVTYYNENDGSRLFSKPFLQLSEISHTTTLYYETKNWGGRISSIYRSPFISEINSDVLTEEDERGFHATNYLDGQLYYYIGERLKLSIEGINLTNEREEQYSNSSDRPYNTTVSGRTFLLGFTYSFE